MPYITPKNFRKSNDIVYRCFMQDIFINRDEPDVSTAFVKSL
ncbi:hypothetical protein TREVI0001_1876 [Treponema vincentii ATCC 35580]|uniref:Uncharacterized protein n=1 Tax=Treponema vincentii ATCC 35580 TaxID=596324 RepID=C8PPD3_9SPIR|nr:hypothetical protein TREVI0001_1876 [Treponema vincentii ATCC 35580]